MDLLRPKLKLRPLLLALTALLLIFAALGPSERRGITQISWRPFSQWKFGLKKLAFCSEQNAALRGWKVDFGPLEASWLRFVVPPVTTQQP